MQWLAVSALLVVTASDSSYGQGPLSFFETARRLYQNPLQSFFDSRVRGRSELELLPEYDFVIVGAGSAGAPLAARLSENPSWTILVLEAGDDESPMTDVPALVSYFVSTDYNWGYKAEQDPRYCKVMEGGRCNWPRGKVLGGTSVLNFMVYTRGAPQDYDGWAAAGNQGWGYEDLKKYFLKSEDARGVLSMSPHHGVGGPQTVEIPPWRSSLADLFLESGVELGYEISDPAGPKMDGFSFAAATMRDGRRCSTAKAYLRPAQNRPNLHISKRSRATKVIMQGKRAIGVEFLRGRRRHRALARKEVLLSSGALNTPQLLMLSGIGPAEHLASHGIPVVADLPVGEGLQDHVSFFGGVTFLVNDSVTVIESRSVRNMSAVVDYWTRGAGPMTSPGGAEGIAFVRTPRLRDPTAAPDMELTFGPGALTGDSSGSLRRLLGLDERYIRQHFGPIFGRDAFTINPVLLRPRSRGAVRLRSTNPLHWPLFYPNYYDDEEDVRVMVEGIKMAVAAGESKAFRKYGARLYDKPIPGCDHHPFRSDAYWGCAARTVSTNLHHQSCTARMGPDGDAGAVLDPQLKVRGITGLRVVDASALPSLPSGHTSAVVIMVAEKAADLIKESWDWESDSLDGRLTQPGLLNNIENNFRSIEIPGRQRSQK